MLLGTTVRTWARPARKFPEASVTSGCEKIVCKEWSCAPPPLHGTGVMVADAVAVVVADTVGLAVVVSVGVAVAVRVAE